MTVVQRASDRRIGILPDRAVEAWVDVLGAEGVSLDAARCGEWGRRTFGDNIPAAAVLRPATADDIAAVMRVAGAYGVPVHPVSRGNNWGLGSRAPSVPGSVILDLSGMTRVWSYDAEQGIVRVEPGVTFAELATYLARRRSRFFVPEIGGAPDASVLANALDRGDGALSDRWASIGDLTVVLPDGRVIDTGYSAVRAERLAGLHPGPAGPLVDGLFSQSNFGIVVAATVRLEPMPENLAIFNAQVESLDRLSDLLDVWRTMQISGAVGDRAATLWNGVKCLAREAPRADHDEADVRRAETELWRLSGFVRAETAKILAVRCQGVLDRFSEAGISAEGALVRTAGRWHDGCEGLLGRPHPRNLRTVYWAGGKVQEAQAGQTPDPDRDGCGLLWLCLALPFDRACLVTFARRALPLLRRTGIDFNIGLEAASFRCLLAYVGLNYLRTGPESDRVALALYETLVLLASELGLAPYRLANGAPLPEAGQDSALLDYLSQLRAVGDPVGILSPGRVGIR